MSHRHYERNWPERERKPHVYDTFLGGKPSRLGKMMPMTRNCLTILIPDEDSLLIHSVTTSSDLDSTESRKVSWDTISMTWNFRLLKEVDGMGRVLEGWQGIDYVCTQVSRWGGANTPTLPRKEFSWEAVLGFLMWCVAGKSTHTIIPLIIII